MKLLSKIKNRMRGNYSSDVPCDKSDSLRIDIGHCSVLGTRSYQEDAYRLDLSDDGTRAIGLICDGMGGLDGGDIASNKVADFVMSQLLKDESEGRYIEHIDHILAEANEMVHELKDSDGMSMRSGTTLVLAIIDKGKFDLISVGDSRLYFYEAATDQMIRLTREHNYLFMAEQLKDDSSFVYDPYQRGDALVSFIGAPEIRYVDKTNTPIELKRGDKILLCSDGLINLLSDEEIKKILVSKLKPQEIAEKEIDCASKAVTLGQDNTTVIVMEMK